MATYPWDTRRDISTRELVDELRMPRVYGDTWGDPRGMVDPLALTAHAQGGPYDIQARRNAIAKRLLENQLAQQAAQAASTSDAGVPRITVTPDYGGASQGVSGGQSGDVSQGVSGQTSSGATDFSSPGNTGSTGWGGSAAPGSDFMGGAPAGPSMFGTGDRAFDPGGAMTTSNASMVGDPAQASPSFTDPGYSNVSPFGRTGDDTGDRSQSQQAADRAALAESVGARSSPDVPGNFAGRGGGKEGFGEIDVGAIAQAAPGLPSSSRGKGDFGDFGEQDQLAEGATSTMGGKGSTTAMGIPGWGSVVPGSVVDAFGNAVDKGKTAVGGVWDAAINAIPGTVPTGAPVATAPLGAPPGGRAPVAPSAPMMSFAPTAPNAPATPGVADPGGFSGFGGFSEPSPGGYTGGPGSTEGFGAGYSGSSSMGNTQGAQGFTTGGFSSDPGTGGFGGTSGSGDTSGGGAGDTSGGGGSSGGDTAGGSAGSGVG